MRQSKQLANMLNSAGTHVRSSCRQRSCLVFSYGKPCQFFFKKFYGIPSLHNILMIESSGLATVPRMVWNGRIHMVWQWWTWFLAWATCLKGLHPWPLRKTLPWHMSQSTPMVTTRTGSKRSGSMIWPSLSNGASSMWQALRGQRYQKKKHMLKCCQECWTKYHFSF